MHVVAECRNGINRVDDVLGKVSWMRGGEADPADARQFPDSRQQLSKTLLPSRIAVRVHVLPEQLDPSSRACDSASPANRRVGPGRGCLPGSPGPCWPTLARWRRWGRGTAPG